MQEFEYPLPDEAIAQMPAVPRDSAKLLVDKGPDEPPQHLTVANLPDPVSYTHLTLPTIYSV